MHLAKAADRGVPLEAAIVVGGPPSLGYVSVNRLPTDVNELAFVGGIAGEPLEVVRCKTIDLEVPAHAEIVIEGELSSTELEPEAPFGEAFGLMGQRTAMPYFNVKCITHRKDAIWQAFLSQFPPSESSKIRGIGREGFVCNYLREDHNIPEVIDIAMHESCGSCGLMVIRIGKNYGEEIADQDKVWRALEEGSAFGFSPTGILVLINTPWETLWIALLLIPAYKREEVSTTWSSPGILTCLLMPL